MVRDIAFSESLNLLTVASREARVKTIDIRTRLCSSIFSVNDKSIWSCGFDRNEREHFLYAGDLRGGVYVFDVRFPETILSEFQAVGKYKFTPNEDVSHISLYLLLRQITLVL